MFVCSPSLLTYMKASTKYIIALCIVMGVAKFGVCYVCETRCSLHIGTNYVRIPSCDIKTECFTAKLIEEAVKSSAKW